MEELGEIINHQRQIINKLEIQLDKEQECNGDLLAQLHSLRTSTNDLLDCCEQAQEGICNRLLREIARLRQEQLDICEEVEFQDERLLALLDQKVRSLSLKGGEKHTTSETEGEATQARMAKIERLPENTSEHSCSRNSKTRLGKTSSRSSSVASSSRMSSFSSSPSSIKASHTSQSMRSFLEKEAEMNRKLFRLQEENQELLIENTQLKNRLRRLSVEDVSKAPFRFSLGQVQADRVGLNGLGVGADVRHRPRSVSVSGSPLLYQLKSKLTQFKDY